MVPGTKSHSNHLIAKFMALGCQHKSNDGKFPLYENPLTGEYVEPLELSYDESWDWLMPVAQKISLMSDSNNALYDGKLCELYGYNQLVEGLLNMDFAQLYNSISKLLVKYYQST